MVESIKKRGDAKMRKMAEALDKQASGYREARVVAESARSFMAAPTIEIERRLAPNREGLRRRIKGGAAWNAGPRRR